MKTNYARHVRTCCKARKVKISQFKGWRYFDKLGRVIHEDQLPTRQNRGQVLDAPPKNLKKALVAQQSKHSMQKQISDLEKECKQLDVTIQQLEEQEK